MFGGPAPQGVVIKTANRSTRFRVYVRIDIGIRRGFVVPVNTTNNALRAVTTRVMTSKFTNYSSKPKPDNKYRFRATRWFWRLVRAETHRMTPFTLKQSYEKSPPDKKKPVYLPAYISFEVKPRLGDDPDDLVASPFVKVEKTDVDGAKKKVVVPSVEDSMHVSNNAKHPKPVVIYTTADPRAVTPFSPRFNLVWMKYVLPLGKESYRAMDAVFDALRLSYGAVPHKTVMKGLNADERAFALRQSWDNFSEPVAIMADMVRLDGHFDEDIQKCLFNCSMEQLLHLDSVTGPEYRQCVKTVLNAKAKWKTPDATFTYRVQGTMSSGRPDTSDLDIKLVMTVIYSYIAKHNFLIDAVDDGDDHVLFCERRNATFDAEYEKHALRFGFPMEVEDHVDVFERVEFCSTFPLWIGDRWRMVRHPKSCIPKDLFILTPLPGNTVINIRKHAAALADCGLALYSSVPVLGSFYRWLKRLSHGYKPSKLRMYDSLFDLSRNIERIDRVITDDVRQSFYRGTGWNSALQLQMESYFDEMGTALEPGAASRMPFAPMFERE